MKYLVVGFLILGFIGSAFGQSMGDISDRVWLPNCPIGTSIECDQSSLFHDAIALPFFQSDSVVVGTIVEKNSQNPDSILYSIDVDFYLKNYQPFDLITATLNDPPEPQTLPEVFWYNSPVFNEGDLVFAYLKKNEGGYRLLPESFALDKHEVRGPPPSIHWNNSPSEDIFDQGEKILVSGEVRKMELVKATKENKQLNVILRLVESDDHDNMVFSDVMEISYDGTYNYFLDSSKIPPGNYELEVNYGPSTFGNDITITPNFKIWTPLKQISVGISMDEIECRENLVLVQKYDGSPACVTAKTKLKLIEREWATNDFAFSDLLKDEILSQLRKGQQNVNGTAKDFVVFEAIHDKSLSGILKDSEYQVNCCSYLLDGNSLHYPLTLGITFQIDEKRMIVTAEYDLQKENFVSIGTYPIKAGGFVSFSEESENNGVYTTMKPNTMEFFYYPDDSSGTQEPYRLFMLIRLPEWMGGGANDTSAFRAYSAKSLDDPCIVKYWPQEGRQRIENPCQGGMYRVIDGTITHGLTHRSTAMTALPHLDLSIDEAGGLYVDTPSWTKNENGVIGYGRDMSLDEIRNNSEFLLDSFENSYPEYPKIPLSFAGYLLSEIYPEKNRVTVWYLDFPNKSGNISMSIDKLSHTDYANLATPHSEFWKIGDTMIKISGSALDKDNELPEQYKTYTVEFNDGLDFQIEGKNLEFIKKEIVANFFPELEYGELVFISRNE